MSKRAYIALAAAIAAAPPPSAHAQSAAPSAGATAVSGVDVKVRRRRAVDGIDVQADWCPVRPRGEPRAPPRVVASSPEPGDVVAGGPVLIQLTFDQPMACGWSLTYDSTAELCTQVGYWDVPARRTWTMRCTLPPGREALFRFDPVEGHGFASLSGVPAQGYALTFSTAPAEAPAAPPRPFASAERTGALVCPEHRRRGSGPQCRYVRDAAGPPPPPVGD